MGYSKTCTDRDAAPSWSRYAVMICRWADHAPSPVQHFSCRAEAERWARVCSRRFPARTGDALTMWALVYALGATGRERVASGGVCYLAIDPGATIVKAHAIPPDYGHRAARTTEHAAY